MRTADPLRLFGILRIPGFLDAAACAELRAAMEAGHDHAASIVAGEETESVDERARKTQQILVDATARSLVQDRLGEAKGQLEAYFEAELGPSQDPHFLTYGVGDFFTGHRDAHPDAPAEFVRQRKVSVVIFLNAEADEADQAHDGDAYSGGALVIDPMGGESSGERGIAIRGEAGLLVGFRSELFHEVKPVTAGRRHTVVTWFPGP